MKMLTSNPAHRSSLAKELHHYLSPSLVKISKIGIILTCQTLDWGDKRK